MDIKVKDFQVGETAYVLHDNHGHRMNDVPMPQEVAEVTVIKCGRKYVSVAGNHYAERQFQAVRAVNGCLVQKENYGKREMLFLARRDVDDYLKKERISRALHAKSMSEYMAYSAEQLAQVAGILGIETAEREAQTERGN